jgi:hypothetical protein
MDTPAPQSEGAARVNWRSVAWITGAALALYVVVRLLPTGTNLQHLDFQVQGKGALEMCDPSRPQFIPVVTARSPVTMRLDHSAATGPHVWTLTLETVGGKPIGPVDLVTVHTRKLHLLAVDSTLTDYQHIHPEPTGRPGEWSFTHVPRHGGVYRLFTDFTPMATGRGLYAFSDYTAPGAAAVPAPELATGAVWTSRRGDWIFTLTPSAPEGIHAGQATALRFAARFATPGGVVPLETVMGAYAHLVAFDAARTGFAHLHPRLTDQGRVPDRMHPELNFDLMIPLPGRYVIWAQLQIRGEPVFVPFWFEVQP